MPKLTKDQALALIHGSNEANFIVRTESEETQFLTNYRTAEVEKEVKPAMRELYDRIDREVLTLTAVPKNQNEKTSEYVNRVLSDYKNQLSNADVKKLNDQIEDLKKNGVSAQEIENVRKAAQAKEKELNDRITAMQTDLLNSKIEVHLNSALSGIAFKDIPKSVKDTFIGAKKAELLKKAKLVEDGTKIIFVGEDGNTILDKSTYQPKSAESILKEELADIIDTGVDGKGAGTETTDKVKVETDKDGKKSVAIVVPPTVKTKSQLREHLHEKGLVSGSEEYDVAFSQFGKDLPLA